MALLTDIRSRRGSKLRQLVLDGHEWRTTSADAVAALGLVVGHIEDPDALEARLEAVEPRCARDRAIRSLAYRDRSRADLLARLRDEGYPEAVAQTVVADLSRQGLADDERFASGTARVLATVRGFGRDRILRELAAHGVDAGLALAAVEDARPAEQELEAASTLARSLATRPGATADKVAARLVRKGFRTPLALRAAQLAVGESHADDASDLPVPEEF